MNKQINKSVSVNKWSLCKRDVRTFGGSLDSSQLNNIKTNKKIPMKTSYGSHCQYQSLPLLQYFPLTPHNPLTDFITHPSLSDSHNFVPFDLPLECFPSLVFSQWPRDFFFFCLFVVWWATSSCALSLLLALHSEISPSRLRKPHGVLGTKTNQPCVRSAPYPTYYTSFPI